MIAIPFQPDGGFASVLSAGASPAQAGSQGESGFAEALLSAVGGESEPTAGTGKLTTDPDPSVLIHEEERQQDAEVLVAINLTAPVTPAPVLDPVNILGATMAAHPIEPTPMPAGETSEGARVQPLVNEGRGEPAGGAAKPVVPLPSEFNAAPAPAPPAPAIAPIFGNTESSKISEVPLPLLTTCTPQETASTLQQSVTPAQPLESDAPTKPAAAREQDKTTPRSVRSRAEEGAEDPKLRVTVSSRMPAMKGQGAEEPVLQPAGGAEVPAGAVVKAQGVLPAQVTAVVASAAEPTEAAAGDAKPEPQKPSGPKLRAFAVDPVVVGVASADHPAHEFGLLTSLHRATVPPTPGQAPEKPKADEGGTELHGVQVSSGQGQVEAPPADSAPKIPETSAGKEPGGTAPAVAAQNPHSREAVSAHDGEGLAVPALSPTNESLTDSGTPTPAMKTRTALPADSAANPLPANGGVNVARVVERVGQSEMHIGLRTLAFGSVEVHTVVRDSQVGLAVGSEKGDLRTFLAAEVPGLQTTFHQHDLHFDNIRFLDNGPGFDMGFSAGADSQSRSFQQGGRPAPGLPGFGSSPVDCSEVEFASDTRTGLNVHA